MGMIGTVQAARRLGCDSAYIRMLIAEGRIKASKIGNSWVIDERSLEAFERQRRTRGRPPKPKH